MTIPAARGDIRLARGAVSSDRNAEYGRLEIFDSGGWGSVCDRDRSFQSGSRDQIVSDASVNVACRELWYDSGEKTVLAVCLPVPQQHSQDVLCCTVVGMHNRTSQ